MDQKERRDTHGRASSEGTQGRHRCRPVLRPIGPWPHVCFRHEQSQPQDRRERRVPYAQPVRPSVNHHCGGGVQRPRIGRETGRQGDRARLARARALLCVVCSAALLCVLLCCVVCLCGALLCAVCVLCACCCCAVCVACGVCAVCAGVAGGTGCARVLCGVLCSPVHPPPCRPSNETKRHRPAWPPRSQ